MGAHVACSVLRRRTTRNARARAATVLAIYAAQSAAFSKCYVPIPTTCFLFIFKL